MIGTEHLLLSILKEENNLAAKILNEFKVDYELVKDELDMLMGEGYNTQPPKAELPGPTGDDDNPREEYPSEGSKKQSDSKSSTPVLDNFGRDLTKFAEDDKLDPIVGRDKEIERVSQILI